MVRVRTHGYTFGFAIFLVIINYVYNGYRIGMLVVNIAER